MVASDSIKRWILLGYSDEKPCTFATFLRFIGHEQIFWTPTPGWLIPSEVEGSTEMWNHIGSCLKEAPNTKREAEIIAMVKEGPERLLKELVEAFGKEIKVGSEGKEHETPNMSEREPAERNLIKNDPVERALTYEELSTGDTSDTEMVDAQRTTDNTKRSQRAEPHHSLIPSTPPCPYHFFSPLVSLDLPFFQFLLTLPSATDKYLCAASRSYPHIATLSPIAHIATFDDLQTHENSLIKTGYSLAHDVLTDDILIRMVTWFEPSLAPATGYHPRKFPPPIVASWSRERALPTPLLFRGSPARLATLVLEGELIAKPPLLARGFDLLLKLVASEWMLVNADVLKVVKSPDEHRGTFTNDLHRRLLQYVEGPGSGILRAMPFPNRWRKGMLDLTRFENVLLDISGGVRIDAHKR